MKKLTCTVAALAFSIITCLMSMRHENVFGPGTGQVVAIIVSVIVIPLRQWIVYIDPARARRLNT